MVVLKYNNKNTNKNQRFKNCRLYLHMVIRVRLELNRMKHYSNVDNIEKHRDNI